MKKFDIDRHMIPFLTSNIFLAEISRRIMKVESKTISTAAIGFDQKNDQITMYYNAEFLESLDDCEIHGLIKHEYYHFFLGHLVDRRKEPHFLFNVAGDLAINSLIIEHGVQIGKTTSKYDVRLLPKSALIPGQWPITREGKRLTSKDVKSDSMEALIASFPKLKSAEWYFSKLVENKKDDWGGCGDAGDAGDVSGSGEGAGEGAGEIGTLDDHSLWDQVPEDKREYVKAKITDIIKNAVNQADSKNSWGNIPQELREEIRKSISGTIDWKNVLRQFVGSLVRGARTSSIKKINRRYPYIHPGIKRSYVAKLIIFRDESGSVSNEMLSDFFAELASLTKNVEIDFCPFDCYCDEKDIVPWRKGTIPEKATKRTRGGGTDFNAPTAIINDVKNRKRWDGALIMTDGYAPKPEPSYKKRGWVLAKGCKLEFESPELQIKIENNT